jgi:glycosyltransferase involved in cell wall biosynthesis
MNFERPDYSSKPGMRRLRILMLSLEYGPDVSGGAGTHVQELANGLGQLGHNVSVVAYGPKGGRVLSKPNVLVHLVPASDKTSKNAGHRSMVQSIAALNDDLERCACSLIDAEKGFDVIHYHNWTTFKVARRCSERSGIPLAGTIHFLSEPVERWWGQQPDPEIILEEKGLFECCHPVVAVSDSLCGVIKETHGISRKMIRVIRNGIDSEALMRRRLNEDSRLKLRNAIAAVGEPIILFAGRLSPMKGVAPLLESAAKVIAEAPATKYLLVGEPDSRSFSQVIDGLLKEHPLLAKRVKLLGRLPRNQLASLYQVADIATVPSVYDPFPYVPLEAMSAGLPVVAARSGGLPEAIQHEVTGLLVPVRQGDNGIRQVDVDELSAALLRLIRDPECSRRFGANGRERMAKEFDIGTMVRSYAQLYREVAA